MIKTLTKEEEELFSKLEMSEELLKSSNTIFSDLGDLLCTAQLPGPRAGVATALKILRAQISALSAKYAAADQPPPDFNKLVGAIETLVNEQNVVGSLNEANQAAASPTMKPVVNKCDPYDGESNFMDWMRLFENFLVLSQVADDPTKARLLLNFIGPAHARKVISRCKPRDPTILSWSDLKTKCINEIFGSVDPFTANLRLAREQEEGETVQDFVVELQTIVEGCGLSSVEEDTILKNRFASGLRSEEVKIEVYKQKPTTFNEAVELATRLEVLYKSTRKEVNAVHHFDKKERQRGVEKRGPGSRAEDCDERKQKGTTKEKKQRQPRGECFVCGKPGH